MKKKIRESNIELLRVFATFMILVLHANFVALSAPSQLDIASSPCISFIRFFIESLCIVSVSIFIYISGWFTVKTSWKSVLTLLFQIIYFWGGVYIFFVLLGKTTFSFRGVFQWFSIRHYDWFVKAYMFLFVLAPILNAYISITSEKIKKIVIISFFSLAFIYCFVGGRNFFQSGYSPFFFIGYYLLANYVKENIYNNSNQGIFIKIFRFNRYIDLSIYIFFSFLTTALAMFSKLYSFEKFYGIIYAYDNPLVYIAGFYLFLFFAKTKMSASKLINFLGFSSFAVYLFHTQIEIREYFISFICFLDHSFPFFTSFVLIFVYLVFIFLVSLVLDQFRIFLWKKIDNLCLKKGFYEYT